MTIDPIDWVTPTIAAVLSQCMLAAAYRSDPSQRGVRRDSLPAALGTVSHRLAEDVANGAFDDMEPDEVRTELEAAWERAIDQRLDRLRGEAELGAVPEPAHWPGYQLVRVRTLRRLREEVHRRRDAPHDAGDVISERRLEDPTTRLAGTPDRVEITARGIEIVDLKTGWRVGDHLSSEHRRQLLIYAYLWHAVHADWPRTASVQRLDGVRVQVEVVPAEATTEAREATRLLDRYNTLAASGTPPEHLARPSEAACRGCSYKGVCPAFLAVDSTGWAGRRRTFAGIIASHTMRDQQAVLALAHVRGGAGPEVRVVVPMSVPALGPGARTALVDALAVTPSDFRVDWETRILTD